MPYASKYLATGLITFDMAYVTCATLHKFITESVIYIHMNNLCSVLVQLTYTTTALMSLERMLVLAFPMRYLQLGSEKRIRFIINAVWLTVVVLFSLLCYFGCWIIYQDMEIFYRLELCRQLRFNYYILLVAIVQTISLVSYSVVFRIVKKQTQKDNMSLSITSLRKLLRMYKSTFMVMKYIVVMTLTSVGYITVTILVTKFKLARSGRIAIDTIIMLNCFLDPFLYVFWNTECREKCKQVMSKFMCRKEIGQERRCRLPDDIAIIDVIYQNQQQPMHQEQQLQQRGHHRHHLLQQQQDVNCRCVDAV